MPAEAFGPAVGTDSRGRSHWLIYGTGGLILLLVRALVMAFLPKSRSTKGMRNLKFYHTQILLHVQHKLCIEFPYMISVLHY